jgi:hypothetical protein
VRISTSTLTSTITPITAYARRTSLRSAASRSARDPARLCTAVNLGVRLVAIESSVGEMPRTKIAPSNEYHA